MHLVRATASRNARKGLIRPYLDLGFKVRVATRVCPLEESDKCTFVDVIPYNTALNFLLRMSGSETIQRSRKATDSGAMNEEFHLFRADNELNHFQFHNTIHGVSYNQQGYILLNVTDL